MKTIVKKSLKFIGNHKVRLAISAVLIALLFITPALTSAQYVWKLNGYTIIQAKEFYFASNYLTTSGSMYRTRGWDGRTNPTKSIEIRNFSNALLSNPAGEDVEYQYTWTLRTFYKNSDGTMTECLSSDSNLSQYMYEIDSVTKTDSNGAATTISGTTTTAGSATGTITGNGTPKKDTYDFTLKEKTVFPTWGSYIMLTMTAHNTNTDSFTRSLSCTFIYELTSTADFVTRFDLSETDGYRDLTINVGTGESPDMTGKTLNITVWWDNTKLDINPFNPLYQQLAGNYKAQYSETYPGYSSIKITGVGSKTSRTLELYKIAGITLTHEDGTTTKVAHNLSNLQNWSYQYTDGTNNYFTDDLIIAANAAPGEAAASGKIIGYFVEIQN